MVYRGCRGGKGSKLVADGTAGGISGVSAPETVEARVVEESLLIRKPLTGELPKLPVLDSRLEKEGSRPCGEPLPLERREKPMSLL